MSLNNKLKQFAKSLVEDTRSDEELLMAIALKRENKAFEIFYLRYKDKIYSYLYRISGAKIELASELTQDVFLKVLNKSSSFNHNFKATTWLWSIARHTYIDHVKRSDAYNHLDNFSEDVVDDFVGDSKLTEDIAMTNNEMSYLNHCYEELKDTDKELFLLRFTSEMSYEDIAETINFKLATDKTHIHRLRSKIIACLKKTSVALSLI